jgi:ABC-2 type transport system ATP-binding protein
VNEPAIEVRGLKRRFKEVEALRGMDLTVSGPGVFGFLGVNGAGKTTTFRILTGLIRPDAGEVRVLGSPVGPGHDAVFSRVGYLPQYPAAYGWMKGEEFLHFIGDLFGLGREATRRRAGELLERCGLKEASKRRIGGYSGGMKQRIGIAQALMNSPELLLLDEPVSSLDPVGRAEVLDLIERLGKEATVFMSSHILGDVERISRDVAVIDKGRILVSENMATLKERYLQPAFDLVLKGGGARFVEAAKKLSGVKTAVLLSGNNGGEAVRVTVLETVIGRRDLPGLVSKLGLELISFRSAVPTLEEVFLQIIGKDAPGEVEKK